MRCGNGKRAWIGSLDCGQVREVRIIGPFLSFPFLSWKKLGSEKGNIRHQAG